MARELTVAHMRQLADKKNQDCLDAKTLDLSNACALEFTIWTATAEVCARLEEILARLASPVERSSVASEAGERERGREEEDKSDG